MKRYLITVLAIVSLVAVVAVACAPTAAPSPEAKEKEVKVGIQVALTGPLSSTTSVIGLGALDYLKYVNDALGGIEYQDPATGEINKIKMHLIWGDNSVNVPKGISIYKRQKAAGMKLLILSACAPIPSSVSALCSRDQIAVAAVGAGSAGPVSFAPEPLYYTASGSNTAETDAAILDWFADQWTEARPPRVGCFTVDNPSQRMKEIPEGLPAYAKKLGFEWLGHEWIPITATDTSVEWVRMMAKEPDLLIFSHVTAGYKVMLEDALRLGFIGKATIAGPFWCWDPTLPTLVSSEAVEGIVFNQRYAFPDEDVPGVALARNIAQSYGHNESYSSLYIGGVCDTMKVIEALKNALEEVGYQNLDGTVVNDALHHLTNFDPQGLSPPITVDPNYPCLTYHLRMGVVEGGKLRAISDWAECPKIRAFMPERYQ